VLHQPVPIVRGGTITSDMKSAMEFAVPPKLRMMEGMEIALNRTSRQPGIGASGSWPDSVCGWFKSSIPEDRSLCGLCLFQVKVS
jgi:hypothetical protein